MSSEQVDTDVGLYIIRSDNIYMHIPIVGGVGLKAGGHWVCTRQGADGLD